MADKKTKNNKDESSKIICPECGFENSKLSKFCTNCGSVLHNESDENLASDKETYKTKIKKTSRLF